MALFSKEKPVSEKGKMTPAVDHAVREGSGGEGEEKQDWGAVPTELNAYLGRGSAVSGKLSFSGAVRLDGRVEGEISAQETLFVGETAEVNAQISGNAVIITGKVTGDITARKRVEIRAPGRLLGNVSTPILIIHEGVIFEGHCTMGGADAERDSKIARLPRDEKGRDKGLKQQNESGR